MTKCEPVFYGLMLQFLIFYCSGALAMIHLSCRTIPLLSVSQPRYIWAIDLLSLTLTGSHRQMCPCLRYILVWSCQLDVNAWFICFTRHDLMMNSSFSLYASTEQSSEQVISILAMATVLSLPPSRATLLLGSFYPMHVCSRINLPTEFCHANCIYPIDTLPVAICLTLRCQAQWHKAFRDIIQPLTKGLRHFRRVQTPIFFTR